VKGKGGARDWILAIGAGLVWACAFPPVPPPWALAFAWVVPGLLLWVTCAEPRRAFLLGLVAGVAHYFSSLCWLLYIPVSPGNYAGWFALSGYCSLYPAVWAAFCWRLFPGDREKSIAEALAELPSCRRAIWGLACALGWVALECLRGWGISGFPWNYLGASQLEFTRLAMLAQFTGVLGVSLVVAWMSVGGVLVFWRWENGEKFELPMLKELAGPAGLLVLAIGLGSFALAQPLGEKRDELKIALIQPSIPQKVLWNEPPDREAQHKRFKDLMDLSERAVGKNPNLLVWPEASVPPMDFRDPSNPDERITNLLAWAEAPVPLGGFLNPSYVVERMAKLEASIQQQGIWRVWGADTVTNRVVSDGDGNKTVSVPFNSCVLLDANSSFLMNLTHQGRPIYSKQHLVMFGEYVPLKDVFPFLQSLAPVSGFGRGTGPVVFDLGKAKTSVLICFEDVMPKLARKAATPEVDFLLNLTNDGWFGNSHQQWQHARSAAWRAIETRRPLVRCTNNGITGWVDEYGRFHGVLEPVHSPRVNVVTVPIRRGPHGLTFYQRTGDWLAWGAVVVCLGLLAAQCWQRRNDSASAAIPDK